MSSRRPPSAPPDLPGFTYQKPLGSGGFADVFLYQQHLPERLVAVKVLLADQLDGGSAEAFRAEANMMARVSSHPAIVSIYQAGVSDDGRPYLVMEYCPKPNLQVRYRAAPFSVAESLRVGVQVASAVETAHRAGILHRDIKPANVLVTEYNRPALTDFGIAVAGGGKDTHAGMSIPWSPPEVLVDPSAGTATADVYALGATVYTLLAGRSPFELPGQRNMSSDLIQRIETRALPALGRPDVPDSLQQVLERAMAKSALQRYGSAIDFARALQRVQRELSMSPTPIDVLDDSLPSDVEEEEDDGLTRIRAVVSIDPTAPPAARTTTWATDTGRVDSTVGRTVRRDSPVAASSTTPVDQTVLRADTAGGAPVDQTVRRAHAAPEALPQSAPPSAQADAVAPRRSKKGLIGALVGALVVVGTVIAVWVVSQGGDVEKPTQVDSGTQAPVDVVSQTVPLVEIEGRTEGANVVFTWTNPEPVDGDYYNWGVQQLGQETEIDTTTDTTVTVPAEAGGTTCIEVRLVRSNGKSAAEPAVGCVP